MPRACLVHPGTSGQVCPFNHAEPGAPWNAYGDFVGLKTSEEERKRKRDREIKMERKREEIVMVS